MGGLFIFYYFLKKDKSRNLPNIVSVRLSALVKRFFVSCMRDFFSLFIHLNLESYIAYFPFQLSSSFSLEDTVL